MSEDERGVVFPAGPDGRRSTAALGRAVTADALRPHFMPLRQPVVATTTPNRPLFNTPRLTSVKPTEARVCSTYW